MTDEATVKAKLRRLAATDEDDESRYSPSLDSEHRETIDRAIRGLDDLDVAVAFLADDGLAALERAVDAAERSVSGCAKRGREALAEYRRFEDALACDQFHSGRGTSLGDGDKPRTR